jgi:metallo-beta-lactamase class B
MLSGMSPLRYCLVTLFLILFYSATTNAQADAESRSWNQPVKPFRIIGNIYYVGASDVTSYLIVTPKGHILLDSGFVETVPQIQRNIAQLGFKLRDVKILINSHAHYDHAGGLAKLKQLTGAKLIVSAADAKLLAAGGKGDFAFADKFTYPPVKADRLVDDWDEIMLGGVKLVAHVTPGHTRGSTTWTTKVQDGAKEYNVVFAGSTSAPGYKLVDNEKYPTIVEDYLLTFWHLRALPCDVFLAPHGMFFSLKEKSKLLAEGKQPNPFIDPEGYENYLKDSEAEFRKKLDQQAYPHPERDEYRKCWQPDRAVLMETAEKRRYTLRRVEFLGLTRAPDEKMRIQMRDFNEGDIFTRAKLMASFKKMSRFHREIYPLRWNDVMVGLDERDKTVDLIVCFRPKRG